jgi:hypothetical protein
LLESGLSIHVFAVRNPQHQHSESFVVNVANDAIFPHPASPHSQFVSGQGFTKIPRVAVSGKALLKKPNDPPLGGPF